MPHVIYKINCPAEDCELPKSYNINQTQNLIIRRTEYFQNNAYNKQYVIYFPMLEILP